MSKIFTVTYTDLHTNVHYRERILADGFHLADYPPIADDKMMVFTDNNGNLIRGGMLLKSERASIESTKEVRV